MPMAARQSLKNNIYFYNEGAMYMKKNYGFNIYSLDIVCSATYRLFVRQTE